MFRRILNQLLDLLFPPRESDSLVHAATFTSLSAFPRPLPYRDPLVQALITEAKYQNNKKAQRLLGEFLSSYLHNYIKEYPEIVLVPIPLGPKRRKERGYNQTEEIARFAEAYADTASLRVLSEILVRVRETEPQTSLNRRARLNNMQGAFAVPIEHQPLNPLIPYIVFDDVLTTGATLSAASDALKMAGAKHVIPLTLAH